jgi:hypothetical protein
MDIPSWPVGVVIPAWFGWQLWRWQRAGLNRSLVHVGIATFVADVIAAIVGIWLSADPISLLGMTVVPVAMMSFYLSRSDEQHHGSRSLLTWLDAEDRQEFEDRYRHQRRGRSVWDDER